MTPAGLLVTPDCQRLPVALQLALGEVDVMIDAHRLATSTVATYESHWRTFQQCVEALDHRALPASPGALVAFIHWVIGAAEGQVAPGWSATYVDGILAAVSHQHRQHGYDDPVLVLTSEARQDLRRILKRAQPQVPTAPVTTTDLRRLVNVALPRTGADAAREVALLLHLATGLSAAVLRSSRLRLKDQMLEVWHVGLGAVHVPASCSCGGSDVLLRACLSCAYGALTSHQVRWHGGSFWKDVAWAIGRRQQGPSAAADEAFVLAHSRWAALTFLRTRAWTLLGYDRALRGQDLRGLLRRDLGREQQMWRVRVRRGKNDPYGETVDFAVLPQNDQLVCPVAALDLWLAVRDAAVDDPARAQDGFAFCPTDGRRLRQHSSLSRMSDLATWARWCARAGVSGISQHGLRTGFIVEASRQGHSLEAIAFTARHAVEHTTFGYLRADLALRAARPTVTDADR